MQFTLKENERKHHPKKNENNDEDTNSNKLWNSCNTAIRVGLMRSLNLTVATWKS